jgi:hypothetical protein
MATVYNNLIIVNSSIPTESSREILKTFHVQTLPRRTPGFRSAHLLSLEFHMCRNSSHYLRNEPLNLIHLHITFVYSE